MCQECCKEIDLSKAKVGDRVRSVIHGDGVIVSCEPDIKTDNAIKIKYLHGKVATYDVTGRHYLGDLYPEIVEWLPAKRKVRKEVTVWVNVYRDGQIAKHDTEESAQGYIHENHIAKAVPCTGHYEVEE